MALYCHSFAPFHRSGLLALHVLSHVLSHVVLGPLSDVTHLTHRHLRYQRLWNQKSFEVIDLGAIAAEIYKIRGDKIRGDKIMRKISHLQTLLLTIEIRKAVRVAENFT